MDFVNKFTGGEEKEQRQEQKQESSGGFLGGIGDKINSAAGGGRESEKNEDLLDKGELSFLHIYPLRRFCLQL